MLHFITDIFRLGFSGILEKYEDPRTADLFLMQGPGPTLIILALYLIFCLKVGPAIMKNREPFTLKKVMLIYNLFNVLASILLVREGIAAGFLEYKFTCQPVDYSDNPQAVRMAKAGHIYFLLKIVELLDTVFFVLRKKNNQITFLHVYHHGFMPIFAWTIAKFFSGGHTAYPACMNTIVHVVMYSYYLLAGLGPSFQKYLWWKAYLTKLQLIQFAVMLLHQSQVIFNGCDVNMFVPTLGVFHSIFFFYLFSVFYFKSYSKKKTKKK